MNGAGSREITSLGVDGGEVEHITPVVVLRNSSADADTTYNGDTSMARCRHSRGALPSTFPPSPLLIQTNPNP
jgi:hypothetical protein